MIGSAKILGTSSYLGKILGPNTCHFATDLSTGKFQENETDAHMAYWAAKWALENAGLKSSDFASMIPSTSTLDHTFPATVFFVQEILKIPSCAAVELRGGCSGMAQALYVTNDLKGIQCREERPWNILLP